MSARAPEGDDIPFEMTAERRARPGRPRPGSEHGHSGLHLRPTEADDDVVTAPVPMGALLEAARAMTEPEPPLDLGLYRALERGAELPYSESCEEPPGSGRVTAPPLATELGLAHLLEPEGKPAPSWSGWLRAHGLWLAVGVMLLWLIGSFAVRWLASLWP